MDLTALFYRMVTIFVTIGFGALAGKLRIMDKDLTQKITRLIIYITTPLLILYSVIGTEHLLSNKQVLLLTAIAVCSYAFMLLTSRLIPRLLFVHKHDVRKAGMFEFMYIFSNIRLPHSNTYYIYQTYYILSIYVCAKIYNFAQKEPHLRGALYLLFLSTIPSAPPAYRQPSPHHFPAH